VALWLALGLASKAMLITLPFVFLLLDYWPLGRTAAWRRRLLEKLPFFALSLGAGLLNLAAQRVTGSLASEDALPVGLRLSHAAASYVWYAVKLVWPTDLAILYPHPYLPGGVAWTGWQVIGSLALLLAISGWVLLGKRRPWAIVGWCWYLGMLVPVIGLVHAGVQGMADRYTYLPSIGLFILLAWGGAERVDRLASAWQRRTIQAAAVLAVAALAATAWVQAQYWRDSVSLYQRSQQATGGRSQVHVNLGAVLREQGRIAEAISVYQRGLARYPGHAVLRMNYGNALRDQQRIGEAIEQYREAIRLAPDDPKAHANLARVLASQREFEAATAAAREAVRLAPQQAWTHDLLADILRVQGRSREAIEASREAPLPAR
jgi:Flp pilus assembly protein TadD